MVKLLLLFALLASKATTDPNAGADRNSKTRRTRTKTFTDSSKERLVSFNSEEEKLSIDWAVTIPFVSIPLHHRNEEHGQVSPLVHVNTKTLGLVGLLTGLLSLVTPLFSKTHSSQLNYRSEEKEHWSEMKNTINDMVFGNNYVAPCMQRVVCSIVSVAAHAESPTSMEKIIDGLSSHEWFKEVTNGTIIQEAINAGRRGNYDDCDNIYNDCPITAKLLNTMINEFGIVV
ncbi:uncharacterized protein LOC122398896 [Colletes gigas]|uniref:uncharacterized protein LOC122398896 n=1 Tax=Colletes gigas TaxID=935657 RepID=UPI001C9B040D|nr:uncharacterized protein LOC122398896 [Colletes gigas]